MREKKNNSRALTLHYYSLVEMLVVLAIIAILVGIGAGGYQVGRRWLAQSNTEALLAKMRLAIESYKNDKGYYPLPHKRTNVAVEDAPNLRIDVIVKDYTSGLPTSSEELDRLDVKKNMSAFIDFGKIREDQSKKIENGNYFEYYLKDGWNAPSVIDVTIDGKKYSWGAIKYRCPGKVNPTSFDLYSAGPDRKFAADPVKDMEDDIYAK